MIYQKKILGIDEAGRGSVLGPMVLAGCLFNKKDLGFLKKIGIKDSKLLTPQKRNQLLKIIKKKSLKFKIIKINPIQIDKNNLNDLEAEAIAKIIKRLKPDLVYFDAPVSSKNISKFIKKIKLYLVQNHFPRSSRLKIYGLNHGERKTVIASASILAKIKRDQEIRKLEKKYNFFASGYPSDKKTIQFLKKYYKKHQKFPNFVRKKWQTISKIK